MSIDPRIRQAAAVAAVVVAVGFSYLYLYRGPMQDLESQRAQQLTANENLQAQIGDATRVHEALVGIAATTLGTTTGEVASRFRGALNDIAGQAGLKAVVVNSRNPTDMYNPGGNARLETPSGLRSKLKKQKDFSVIAGDLEAKGSLEQVLRAVEAIQAQPWVHRVDSFSIRPEGKERDTFALKVGVSTVFMSDLGPKGSGEPQIKVVDPSPALAAIVQKNMFHEPVAAAAKPDPTPPGPSAPPPPPYADWRLTGVIESRLGVEAFMVNVKSGEKRTLAKGATVIDARFVTGQGEQAVFEIDGKQYAVRNGQTLEQRQLR